jgi:hypothetical protein
MSKAPSLAAVLADAGGSTRRKPPPEPRPTVIPDTDEGSNRLYRQPSRDATKPITVHFPPEVRMQLKLIALQEDKTLQNLIAEGFNDLFAKYGKPEIAPIERKRS